jgi:hypothetical protein
MCLCACGGRQPAEAMAQLEAFAEARRINSGEMKNVVRSLLTVLRGALRKNLLPKAIVDDLTSLGACVLSMCVCVGGGGVVGGCVGARA